MRKDLRVGLGIGGVLLAVLVVALVVRSHTRQKAPDNKVVAVDKPDAGDNSNPTPPDSTGATSTDLVTPPAPPAAAPPAPAPTDSVKPDDPFREPSTWDKILLDGAMPPTTPTVTPTDHGSGRAIGDHFSPTAGSPAVTPGTIPPHGVTAAEGTSIIPPAARGQRTHVVAQGETLSTIARTAYGSKKYYLLIEKANPSIVPERLRPGTTIILPDVPASEHVDHAADHHAAHGSATSTAAVDSSKEYVVKANDSLYRISMRLYGSANKVDAIYDLNKDLIGPDRGRLKLGLSLKLPSAPTSASR